MPRRVKLAELPGEYQRREIHTDILAVGILSR